MEILTQMLGEAKTVNFEELYLDPNNPRLPQLDNPGYANADELFDEDYQEVLFAELDQTEDLKTLADSIEGSGWIAFDAILVWQHPKAKKKYVVVEGNRRLATLKLIRKKLERDEAKLEEKEKKKTTNSAQIEAMEELRKQVERLKEVVSDTAKITVLPLIAEDPHDLQGNLMRVLAVRHINSAKKWGDYAADSWMYVRYVELFEKEHGEFEQLKLDPTVLKVLSEECSVNQTECKRIIRSVNAFDHFKAIWVDELPDGEEFTGSPGDYFAFQNIVKSPWVREQLGMRSDADLTLSAEGEVALFEWMFKKPHNDLSAEQNENLWSAARATGEWNKLKRHDDAHGTAFASNYDVSDPTAATRKMVDLVAEMQLHKSSKNPVELIEDLTKQVMKISLEDLENQGLALVDARDGLEAALNSLDSKMKSV